VPPEIGIVVLKKEGGDGFIKIVALSRASSFF